MATNETPHSTDSQNHSRAERLAVVSSIKLPRFHLGQRENTFAYLQTAEAVLTKLEFFLNNLAIFAIPRER